jgi:hypothetical protein
MDINTLTQRISELSYETLVTLLLKPMTTDEREIILMRLIEMNHELIRNTIQSRLLAQSQSHYKSQVIDPSRSTHMPSRRKDLIENEHPATINRLKTQYVPYVPSSLTPISSKNYDMNRLAENIFQDNLTSSIDSTELTDENEPVKNSILNKLNRIKELGQKLKLDLS